MFTPTAQETTAGATVTTTLTLALIDTADGLDATSSLTTVTATSVNDPPTIAGGATSYTNDETTTAAFSTITIADVDACTTETMTITLSGGSSAGTLASGATYLSSGIYTLKGTPSFVTTALEALVFTPGAHQASPGNTVTTTITLVASQTSGGSTVSTTGSTVTVVATAVNDAPTISGAVTSSQAITDETTVKPLSTLTVADVDLSTTETVTLTLSSGDADGTLSSGATYVSAGFYTLKGTPSAVSTALQALVFTPTTHQVSPGSTVTTTFTVVASQTSGGSTVSTTGSTVTVVATAVNDAPTISGVITTSQATTDETTTLKPLATVTITDGDLSVTETVAITLSTNGTLSSGATYVSAGFYTLTATPGAVNTALEALVFTPTAHEVTAGSTVTTTISVVASQTGGGSTVSATNTAAAVVATAVNDPPTLTGGAASVTNDETTLKPFSLVTLADVDTSTTDIVTITLSSGDISSSDGNGTIASGATWVSAGTYTLSGLTSVVATALAALVFTPTAHEVIAGSTVTTGFTVLVSQTGGGSTNTATNTASSVVATAVNDPPTLTGGSMSSTNDETTLKPFSLVTLADVDTSTTDIVTITLQQRELMRVLEQPATVIVQEALGGRALSEDDVVRR